MNPEATGTGSPSVLLGIAFHSAVALFGAFALGCLLALAMEALVQGGATDVRALAELLTFVVSGALLSVFTTPRWFSRSAPWVGLLGLAALLIGGHELWHGWSPTWSDQTRSDYVLSQLFGVSRGCGDSECVYMLIFSVPFVSLTAYSIAALAVLRFKRSQLAKNRHYTH
jgi:hypothetical protein